MKSTKFALVLEDFSLTEKEISEIELGIADLVSKTLNKRKGLDGYVMDRYKKLPESLKWNDINIRGIRLKNLLNLNKLSQKNLGHNV